MNYRGSYRKLLGNAKAAMMAAIEIYNKPAFNYRDECMVILLINAWELILKAALSKSGKRIFYSKRRKQPYRTLSLQDALLSCRSLFPEGVDYLPVQRNLELLGTYRDNAVHFYNADGFGVVVYALVQTCIKNFRDFMDGVFNHRLEDEISWKLLPLGIEPPVDVVSYISGTGTKWRKHNSAVRQFLAQLVEATDELKKLNMDNGRLMTIFNIKLESVKKIGDANVVVGVDKKDDSNGPLAIVKRQDPNITHPLRQKEVVEKIKTLHNKPFTSHVFQAIAWEHRLKDKPQYCWRAQEGVLTKYSCDVVTFIKKLSASDVDAALINYRKQLKDKRSLAKKRAAR